MKKYAFLISALALSGCVTLLPEQGAAPAVFNIEAPEAPFPNAQKVDWSIGVARPFAPRILAGQDLVLREAGNQIAFVGGAEWADSTPDILQRTLASALSRSGKIVAVNPDTGARADCEFQWDIYAFDAREGASGFTARFEASARLVGRNRAIQQSTRIVTAGAASGGTVRSAAAALSDAALKAVDEAGNWALQQQCEKPLPRAAVRAPIETPLAGAPLGNIAAPGKQR